MDGITAAASVVGLLVPASQGTQKLLGLIDIIKDAPEEIKCIKADLKAMVDVLDRMGRYCQETDGSYLNRESADTLSDTIEACHTLCADFQRLIDRWLRHSTDGQLFWADRQRLAVWEKGRIEAFQGRLARYRSTITMVLETDSVMRTWQQQFIPENTRVAMLESQRSRLVEELTQAVAAGEQIDARSLQIFEATTSDASPSDQAAIGELRQDAQREFHFLRDDNRRLQQACEDALKRVETARTRQKINHVKASDNSVALAGYINADDDFRVDQDISNITAESSSLAIAGVAKNIDISTLFARR